MATATTDAEDALASRLRLSVARLHRRLRQSADPGLTISQLSALASIERDGPITLGDLARVEQVQPPTMTALTAKLEAAGFVDRAIDPHDRRVHRVAVSAAGARLLALHRKQKNAFLERRLRKLSDDDRAVLQRAAVIMEELTR
ncbi:MAG: MarR family transcriptional regulator [Acidimicrobiia bacterium]